MSLRKSTSGGDNSSMSKNSRRTPLRSLHNENLNDSTESLNVKSKSEQLKLTQETSLSYPQNKALTSADHMIIHTGNEMPAPDGIVTLLTHIPSTKFVVPDTEPAANCNADVTFKSFYCDGGEVEILEEDVERADDTIPLPRPETSAYPQQRHTLDSSDVLNFTGYCNTEEENEDHAYCKRESDTASSTSTTNVLIDKPYDALGDVTLKCMDCTGGEIEIADSIDSDDRTIPLPSTQNWDHAESHNDGVDSQIVTENCDVNHFDHPYCNAVSVCSTRVTNQPSSHEVLDEEVQFKHNKEAPDPETEVSNGNIKIDESCLVSEEQYSPTPLIDKIVLKQQNAHNCDVENTLPSVKAFPSSNDSNSENVQEHNTKENLDPDVSASALPQHYTSESHSKTLSTLHSEVKERDLTQQESQIHPNTQPDQRSDTADSALGLSPNAPASTEPAQAETLPDVFKAITECTPLHLKFLTPIVRRASLAYMQAQNKLIASQLEGDNDGDKSVVAPDLDQAEFWKEHFDSPMSRPLLNSTELVRRSKPRTVVEPLKDIALHPPEDNSKPDVNIPVISDGPLQQQLRQMAEFLMLASGKMGAIPVPAPVAKAEFHNACVGTSPLRQVEHSVNTSGQCERNWSFAVEDQCTLTDPLLWNVPVGSLESVPRPELEQRLLSSMIIVEALVQQLAAARAQTLLPAGAAPSELREKTVQTEHTELSQTSMHRDLYLEALGKIKELEVDNASLKNLAEHMQNVRMTMASLTSDTDVALNQMKDIEEAVREDHRSLVSNYGQMKSLLGKSRESQMRMVQKVKDALRQKENMQIEMEKAISAREAAYSVMDQLRKHSAMEIGELEKCVGSQQQLLLALKKANPEQAALNKSYTETLNLASGVLSKTMEDQTSLTQELHTVRGLLRKSTPIIEKLNEKAKAALRDRDEHIAEKDQALQQKDQVEEELNQALLNLQAAKGQISDLNLQVTILTSEMGVLRQKLSESDDERSQLDRKTIELSATVSSTLASYAFLEQALASETTKLQEYWTDTKEAKERAQELELSLGQSEERVAELSEALSRSEDQVRQLQSLSEAQALQLQQLQDTCAQLSAVRDMNEFLQMENELTREQISESERMLTANLQSLRERNIQCEDLNGELCRLQHENKNLLEELDCVRTKFTASETKHEEKLEQIAIEIAILHHTVRSVTNELHTSLQAENAEQPAHNISNSVVDRDMVAQTTVEDRSHVEGVPEAVARSELVFSASSAFTRVAAVTPKKSLSREAKEQQSNVSELLSGLDSTVAELRNKLASVQQQKDALLQDRHQTICRLQRELEAAHSSHQTEVSELRFQLSRLNTRMEKVQATLEQKSQDDKTVSKLVTEMSEIQEMLNKHKAENNALRREAVELHRSLKEFKSEAKFLHEELRKKGENSAPSADFMEEKIILRKELEKLKMNLQHEEQARKKLLDRAKKHQAIYETNQLKCEKELQLLNNLIHKVRETLLSLPEPVKNCEQLQQLLQYVG